jgi:hypothetical protein
MASFPIHSYGTEGIPQMVNQWGQMMFRKDEADQNRAMLQEERQYQRGRDKVSDERQKMLDQQKLEELKIDRQNKAFDKLTKVTDLIDKYPDLADSIWKNHGVPVVEALGGKPEEWNVLDAKGKKQKKEEMILNRANTASEKVMANFNDPAKLKQSLAELGKAIQLIPESNKEMKGLLNDTYKKGLEVLSRKPEQTKPELKVFNNKLMAVTPGQKPQVVAEGDSYQFALSAAMKDPAWQWADEMEQAELIQKHLRFRSGEAPPKPTVDVEKERQLALEAIKKGADKDKVKEMFKQRTGMVF